GPEGQDNQNSTTLLSAVDNEHEGVVELLLDRENAVLNGPGESYRTPPQCAVDAQEGVIKPPPKRDIVDPNCLEEKDRTPFESAAGELNQSVILSMKEQGNVTPTPPDVNNRTRDRDRCVLL